MTRRVATAAALAAALALGGALVARGSERRPVSFVRDVQPLLDRKCTSCHPAAYPYLDLRRGRAYDALVRVPAATNPAYERVLPGRPELSYLLLHPPDPSDAGLLTSSDRLLLRRWIAAGAPRG